MTKKYNFLDGKELERAGVDTSVLEDWLAEMQKEDYDRDYFMAYPVIRVTWYNAGGDENNNFFDVFDNRETARLIGFVGALDANDIESIEVVAIRVMKEPEDLIDSRDSKTK